MITTTKGLLPLYRGIPQAVVPILPKATRGTWKDADAAVCVFAWGSYLKELCDLKKERDRNKELFGSRYEDMDLVFCQPNGRPLHATYFVKRDFKKLIREAKLPVIRFHDLRHTALSIMAKNGVHPKTLQANFTLSVYGHVLGGMQETAIEGLERSINGEK